MARPQKQKDEKRLERFNLRLTFEEAEGLRERAAIAGLLPHEYARRRVIGHVIVPPPRKADAALLVELNRIGINVNQLARAMNTDREFRSRWEDLAAALEAAIDKVATLYGS
jgi:hypothetical protein